MIKEKTRERLRPHAYWVGSRTKIDKNLFEEFFQNQEARVCFFGAPERGVLRDIRSRISNASHMRAVNIERRTIAEHGPIAGEPRSPEECTRLIEEAMLDRKQLKALYEEVEDSRRTYETVALLTTPEPISEPILQDKWLKLRKLDYQT